MTKNITRRSTDGHVSPFERIRRTNDAGHEFWSTRDFGVVGSDERSPEDETL